MKTIEELAFEKYLNEQKLPERKRTDPSNYLDWAEFGKNEAQRWIETKEENPPTDQDVLIKMRDGIYIGVLYRDGFMCVYHTNGLKSIKLDHDVIIKWRPIERK